jgi:uncharacterized membrane protein YraQ (UPF0718 family)
MNDFECGLGIFAMFYLLVVKLFLACIGLAVVCCFVGGFVFATIDYSLVTKPHKEYERLRPEYLKYVESTPKEKRLKFNEWKVEKKAKEQAVYSLKAYQRAFVHSFDPQVYDGPKQKHR